MAYKYFDLVTLVKISFWCTLVNKLDRYIGHWLITIAVLKHNVGSYNWNKAVRKEIELEMI